MDYQVFHPFLFVIIAILLGITGIVFLILGLISSQPKKWIPGLITFLLALFFGIMAIVSSIRNIAEKVKDLNNYSNSNHWQNTYNTDSLFKQELPVDSNFSEPASGFINDAENSLVYIRIYPHRDLLANKLTIQKITKGKAGKDKLAIEIILDFETTFSGKLNLSIYSTDKVFLGESLVNITGNPGFQSKVNFPFSTDVKFSEADYGTLTIVK
jgi:hypothetical protein